MDRIPVWAWAVAVAVIIVGLMFATGIVSIDMYADVPPVTESR